MIKKYLTRKQQEEISIREEMQKEISLIKVYNSDNKRCIALTQKYERIGVDKDLLQKFKSLYK